ncbi:MAG: alginate export family protein, partial [Nitrococcus sp.]|nr:alginate export family protein [Nitrococcus sp.]
DYGRFNTLQGARVREFGPSGLFGILARENIIMPGIRIEFMEKGFLDGRIVYKPAWLAEKTDASPGDGSIQDPTGQSGSFLGHEIYGRLRYWIVPKHVRLVLRGAAFINGEFFADPSPASNATGNGNPMYGTTDLIFIF